MSQKKKQIRAKFRSAVFHRDAYCCKVCGNPGKDRQGSDAHLSFHEEFSNLVVLDAHHITDRSQMPNGGYVAENGISLCPECHLQAEQFWQTGTAVEGYSPEQLYEMIDSSLELALEASEAND